MPQSRQSPNPEMQLQRLISFARLIREILLEFPFFIAILVGVCRRVFFRRNVWPLLRILPIDLKPFLQTRFRVRLDGFDRTLWLAYPTIDAFIGMDNQHVFPLVEAIDRADLDAISEFALDAIVIDDESHGALRSWSVGSCR